MRRGLISWSRSELPPSVLDARVARAQAAMAQAGIDALAIYSDPSRSAGASYFTAFVPYWNRGVVVIPRDGKPTLFTGMSNRVHGWIKTNAHLDAVIYSTALGVDAAKLIHDKKSNAVVAIPDCDALPGQVIDGFGGNGLSVIDGTALIEKLRAPADPTELAFYFKAATIAHAGLSRASASETDAAALFGAIEAEARRLGAEEIYVALAPDLAKKTTLYRLEGNTTLSDRFAVRATVAYKGTWVRMTRTFARDAAAADEIGTANQRFAAAATALPKADGFVQFTSWLIEGCRAIQPLEPLAGTMLEQNAAIVPGTVVTAQATIDSPRGPVLIGAPVLVGRANEGSSLLVQLDD